MAQQKRERLRGVCGELRGLLESIEGAAAGLPEQDLKMVMEHVCQAKVEIAEAAKIVEDKVW